MNKFISIFRIIFLLVLLVLSIKLIFGDPINGEIQSIDGDSIKYIDCSTGRHANPFFQIENATLKFYVLDDFVYRTNCSGNQENSLVGESVSFLYFKNSPNSGKVIEIAVSGAQVYRQNEYISKSFATGIVLFFVSILFGVWCFFSAKKA